MIAALTGLWSKAYGYIMAAGVGVAFLIAIYLKGSSDASSRAAAREAQDNLKAIKQARDTENEINNLGSNDLDGRYREWLRDK